MVLISLTSKELTFLFVSLAELELNYMPPIYISKVAGRLVRIETSILDD